MTTQVQIGRNLVRRVGALPAVRDALEDRANALAARADQLAAAANYEVNPEIETGVYPDGRPFARVVSSDIDQEFGTYGKKRGRILGRAADSVRR